MLPFDGGGTTDFFKRVRVSQRLGITGRQNDGGRAHQGIATICGAGCQGIGPHCFIGQAMRAHKWWWMQTAA